MSPTKIGLEHAANHSIASPVFSVLDHTTTLCNTCTTLNRHLQENNDISNKFKEHITLYSHHSLDENLLKTLGIPCKLTRDYTNRKNTLAT